MTVNTKAMRTVLLLGAASCFVTALAAVGHGVQAEKRQHAPVATATPAPTPGIQRASWEGKSLIMMTQQERRDRYLAQQEAEREPLEARARWACSGFIQKAAYVPDSLRWVRRSTWPSAPDRGEWFVQATYKATNRLGVETEHTSICQMRYVTALDEWRLQRVSTRRQ